MRKKRIKVILRKVDDSGEIVLGAYYAPMQGKGAIGGPVRFLEVCELVRKIFDPSNAGTNAAHALSHDRSRVRCHFVCSPRHWEYTLALLLESGWTYTYVDTMRRLMS